MRFLFAITFICLLGMTPAIAAEDGVVLSNATIHTQTGSVPLTLETAYTPELRKLGLMNRKHIGQFQGMMFLFPKAQDYEFWMSNTHIPLDMLFINPENKIVHIEEEAQPESLRGISARQLVSIVIELPAGTARAENIQVGDYVKYTLSQAVQPY